VANRKALVASGAAKPRPGMTSRPVKAGADKTLVFRQRGDGLSVPIVEPHVQGVETGLWLSKQMVRRLLEAKRLSQAVRAGVLMNSCNGT
jgi:hypothetical protein